MYENQTEEDVCFDPNNIPEQPAPPPISTLNGNAPSNHNNGFSSHDTNPQIHINNNHHYQQPQESDSSVEFQNPNHLINTNSWVNPTNLNHITQNQDMGYTHFDENLQPTTDLLTLLHLPRCSFASSSLPQTQSLSFGKPSSSPPPPGSALGFLGDLNPAMMVDNPSENGSSTIFYDPTNVAGLSYDPLFHLNLPPQPSPSLRDLMFVPHGYGNGRGNDGNGNGNGNGNGLFGGLDEGNTMNGNGGIYQDNGDHLIHGNGVFEFSKGDGKGGKCPKNFVTERQRRQNFNDKYQLLRSLVPNQTKGDRASIVWDAINHINELRRTVGELKLLVEKKRMSKERIKRHKTDHQDTPSGGGDQADTVVKPDPDEEFNGSTAIQLRSSWIQRKCKDTEVDVRIVDDDVTIKLVQRKKINCLLSVSRTLDDLQLDLRHVAGGHVGDYYSYLFNSKICEGSSVYASAIANKLIEIVEKQYAAASVAVAVAPTTSF